MACCGGWGKGDVGGVEVRGWDIVAAYPRARDRTDASVVQTLDGLSSWEYALRMVKVIATGEFHDWFQELPAVQAKAIRLRLRLLEAEGVNLGTPYSSAVRGSTLPLRELRAEPAGRAIRVLYLFDQDRQAVLLVGGDKSGDARFYETMIRKAERVWAEHEAERETP